MTTKSQRKSLQVARSQGFFITEGEPRIYRIIRFRQNGNRRVIRKNVTLSEAQTHCKRSDTRGDGWFDGYDYMPGCAPKR